MSTVVDLCNSAEVLTRRDFGSEDSEGKDLAR